jgi:hypothetical protein
VLPTDNGKGAWGKQKLDLFEQGPFAQNSVVFIASAVGVPLARAHGVSRKQPRTCFQ